MCFNNYFNLLFIYFAFIIRFSLLRNSGSMEVFSTRFSTESQPNNNGNQCRLTRL